MRNEAIKSKYLKFVKEESSKINDDTSFLVTQFADEILSFIIHYEDISALTEIDFGTIKELVDSDDNKTIKYTLHLLALKPYDVLEWKTYFESDDFYEPTRYYIDNVKLNMMLKKEEFYNPFTDKKVSKKEFAHLVNTVFAISQNFKDEFLAYKELGLV